MLKKLIYKFKSQVMSKFEGKQVETHENKHLIYWISLSFISKQTRSGASQPLRYITHIEKQASC